MKKMAKGDIAKVNKRGKLPNKSLKTGRYTNQNGAFGNAKGFVVKG